MKFNIKNGEGDIVTTLPLIDAAAYMNIQPDVLLNFIKRDGCCVVDDPDVFEASLADAPLFAVVDGKAAYDVAQFVERHLATIKDGGLDIDPKWKEVCDALYAIGNDTDFIVTDGAIFKGEEKLYRVEMQVCATAYVKALSPEAARSKASKLGATGFEVGEDDLDEDNCFITSAAYGDKRLPEISLSPMMSFIGIQPDSDIEEAK